MQITKIQVLAFLILFAGTITFAIEALTGGINDMSMYTIAILTGVSSIFIRKLFPLICMQMFLHP